MAGTRLCSLRDVRAGAVTAVALGGEQFIAVRRADGSVAVFQGRCPHQQMPLADGVLDGQVLACSAHGWTFDLETGRGIEPSFCFLAGYPVRVEGDDVWIDYEVTSL